MSFDRKDQDICELCRPGSRGHVYDEADLLAHWDEKHRNDLGLRWQKAKQLDRISGFGWRARVPQLRVPQLDAESDGLCPVCGPRVEGVGELISRDKTPELFDELLPPHKRGRWGGPFEGPLIVLYCMNDGAIVRVMRA